VKPLLPQLPLASPGVYYFSPCGRAQGIPLFALIKPVNAPSVAGVYM
jgi:hypothetical protein